MAGINSALRGVINTVVDCGQEQLQAKIEDEAKREHVRRAIDKAQQILNALIDEDPNNVDQILEAVDA